MSVDSPTDLPKVTAFVKRYCILSETVLLSAGSPKTWIHKIKTEWRGTLPATIITAHGRMYETFLEGPVTYDQIYSQSEIYIEKLHP